MLLSSLLASNGMVSLGRAPLLPGKGSRRGMLHLRAVASREGGGHCGLMNEPCRRMVETGDMLVVS